MNFTNFNIITLLIFIILFIIIIYFFAIKYYAREKIKSKYKLLFKQSKSYYIKYIFLFLSFIILLTTIFGIELNIKTTEKNENSGVDIVFLLDVSKSMNSIDFEDDRQYYSRLEAAKTIISNYISLNYNNRYGLIIFAGDAISSSPLTNDLDTFTTFLKSVDYRNLSIQGTNIEKAIKLGIQRFGKDTKNAAIIVISDGGDIDEDTDYNLIKSYYKENNIFTSIIGIGSKEGGKIPIGEDFFGQIRYQQHKGSDVVTILNEEKLKKIAKITNGNYIKINNLDGLDYINDFLSKVEKKAISLGDGTKNQDASRIIALFSFILFFIFILISLRKKSIKS